MSLNRKSMDLMMEKKCLNQIMMVAKIVPETVSVEDAVYTNY